MIYSLWNYVCVGLKNPNLFTANTEHRIPPPVFKTSVCAQLRHDVVLHICYVLLSLSPKKTATRDSKIPRKEGLSHSSATAGFTFEPWALSHWVMQHCPWAPSCQKWAPVPSDTKWWWLSHSKDCSNFRARSLAVMQINDVEDGFRAKI